MEQSSESRKQSAISSAAGEKDPFQQQLSWVETRDAPAPAPSGKIVLREEENWNRTAKAFSSKKKWWILTVVALCQTTMNYNAAVYSSAVGHLNEEYHLGSNHLTGARMGMVGMLVTYAFACELWAPWSEELGRWRIMQLSLGLVNIFQLLPALSTSWSMVIAGRVLIGFCSAGGSVTLGMVADMYDAEDQQYSVLWVSLWSCLGALLGGVAGGPIEEFLPWRWNFYIQIIFGVIVQTIHFFTVPETRSTVMLGNDARKRRKRNPNCNIYGPNEVKPFRERFALKEFVKLMWRPYHMLFFEPIVLFLSLLSGFADALIFSFLESYGFVYKQWNFTPTGFSMAMIPLLIGYVAAYFSYFPVIKRHNRRRRDGDTSLTPESRLWWLLFIVPCLPIGILGSAFVSSGPPLPWIAPMIFGVFIGAANWAIYFATIDYMVAAYGEKYAASATGGNGFARDLLAGLCALYTKPMYDTLGIKKVTLLLFAVALMVCIPVYVFYWKGHQIRARSKWAEKVKAEKEKAAIARQRMQAHQV
ncbi:major facilitator superfamily domain-containing protein [Massariosphaeria phaeospora]|uniref:Major facilitator superfamily domain-containing protein n=1 Tax=Massariosphaeria phaeospora TaxID=100035 RepID=A0A7C8MFA1_9PLEO|nr:major facilitator superfamily domain-containing protein [Massariosphaeria phaeospora]